MRNHIVSYTYGDDGRIASCIASDGTVYNDLSRKEYKVSPVTASVEPGEVEANTEVELACSTTNAVIFYTTNGNKPDMTSTRYTKKIKITADVTIKAVAYLDGAKSSDVQAFEYTIAE